MMLQMWLVNFVPSVRVSVYLASRRLGRIQMRSSLTYGGAAGGSGSGSGSSP
jgi:hypothetical protein